ncbi:glycosyltransferase family 2 protein [Sediminitomix flava]|uniref:Glycosyl transferase family 2 n=1 Tax=Sediminitomix flava TaxID=379075 RepID=A0A316A0X6_SEDFL|nr:glycosyltransferase family 2 protein [Sediminitomix flava]PWJ43307.1 glycosyl transferase family 2 [Sediminitomix flava]
MEFILSICIPTYNRADSLGQLLTSIHRNFNEELKEKVEIIISDNNSPDHSYEVVANFQDQLPIKYFRNGSNIGVTANILKVTTYAKGKYGWIIGDDDLLAEDSLKNIVETLENAKNTKGFIIGFSYEKSEIKSSVLEGDSSCLNHESQISDKIPNNILWEESFSYIKRPDGFLTSIVSHIFYLKDWNKYLNTYLGQVEGQNNALESTVGTFAYLMLWSDMFAGKSLGVIQEPVIYFCIGEQKWIGKWKTISFTFLLDVYSYFRKLGVSDNIIRQLTEQHFKNNKDTLKEVIQHPDEYSSRHFSLGQLIRKYKDSVAFWYLLSQVVSLDQQNNVRKVTIYGFSSKGFYKIFLKSLIVQFLKKI